MTEETKAKIRRYNSNIENSGRAAIIFGLWTAIKIVLSVFLNVGNIKAEFGNDEYINEFVNMVYIVTVALAFALLLLHVYVGFCAIRYGRGNRKKKAFKIWAVLLGVISVFFIITDLGYGTSVEYDEIAEFLADSALLFIMIDLLYSMFMAKITIKRE